MINIDLTAITVIYGTFFAFWEHINVFDMKGGNNVSLFKANIDGGCQNVIRTQRIKSEGTEGRHIAVKIAHHADDKT